MDKGSEPASGLKTEIAKKSFKAVQLTGYSFLYGFLCWIGAAVAFAIIIAIATGVSFTADPGSVVIVFAKNFLPLIVAILTATALLRRKFKNSHFLIKTLLFCATFVVTYMVVYIIAYNVFFGR
ncbi:hypothetical protein K2Q00_02645 [Patescibacteria group bacterium]|nr:hypothetical protein [Patescibacteria group bacterium]